MQMIDAAANPRAGSTNNFPVDRNFKRILQRRFTNHPWWEYGRVRATGQGE